ncbi:hypothetical protein LP417_21740 [Polaromonas sp. P1-6]|nr:hypothetical protein LP417_21740 [Polaromonas sp. P1-6]
MRFIEGMTQQQQVQATSAAIADHPEQQLLAFVFGKFKEHRLLGLETETQKMLMLAALNLVECIRGNSAENNKVKPPTSPRACPSWPGRRARKDPGAGDDHLLLPIPYILLINNDAVGLPLTARQQPTEGLLTPPRAAGPKTELL